MKKQSQSMEIREIKSSLLKFIDEDEIETHEYKGGQTHRVAVTKNGRPSTLGYKLIKLALMGKSWRYMSKVTGISHDNIRGLFKRNDIIRNALIEAEEQIADQSKVLLHRSLLKTTKNLVRIATGESDDSAHKQKVQLEAIREFYNRIGFLVPERGGSRNADDYVITVQGGEGKALAVLMERRQKQLAEGGDTSDAKGQEEGGEEGSGGVGDGGPEANGSADIIEGEFTETR